MAEIDDLDPTDANNTGRWPEGMLGGAINDAGRAMEGYLARWFQDINASVTASGSSNAYAITSNRTISSLADNTLMVWTANHTNTGAATLNLNGLGAKSIKRFNGSALASGDIISGQPVWVIYKSSPDQWFMMTAPAALVTDMFGDFSENATPGDPAANVGRLYAKDVGGITLMAHRDSAGVEHLLTSGELLGILEDNQTSGTDGASLPASTTTTRTLNTEVYDRLGILSLSSNRFTIGAAGTYEIEWDAPIGGTANNGLHQSLLYNQTDGAEVKRGTSGLFDVTSGITGIGVRSCGRAVVTITAPKAFEIRHALGAYTDGSLHQGDAASLGTEIFTRVTIRRA